MDKAYILDQLKVLSAKFGYSFDDEIIEAAVGFSDFKVFSKGAVIADIGDKAVHSGIVLNGIVRSYYIDSDGNDITQFFAREGGFIMNEGMIGFDEIKMMWESIEDATVMLFEVSRMKELIMNHDSLKSIWIDVLEGSLRYKMYREGSFLTENAAERYLSFRKRYPDLAVRVQQRYIATYLGIKPESLSRIKATLKEEEQAFQK